MSATFLPFRDLFDYYDFMSFFIHSPTLSQKLLSNKSHLEQHLVENFKKCSDVNCSYGFFNSKNWIYENDVNYFYFNLASIKQFSNIANMDQVTIIFFEFESESFLDDVAIKSTSNDFTLWTSYIDSRKVILKILMSKKMVNFLLEDSISICTNTTEISFFAQLNELGLTFSEINVSLDLNQFKNLKQVWSKYNGLNLVKRIYRSQNLVNLQKPFNFTNFYEWLVSPSLENPILLNFIDLIFEDRKDLIFVLNLNTITNHRTQFNWIKSFGFSEYFIPQLNKDFKFRTQNSGNSVGKAIFVISDFSRPSGISETAQRISNLDFSEKFSVVRSVLPNSDGMNYESMFRFISNRDLDGFDLNSLRYIFYILNGDNIVQSSLERFLNLSPRNYHKIALWAWELECAPTHFGSSLNKFSQIFTVSDFSMESIKKLKPNSNVQKVLIPYKEFSLIKNRVIENSPYIFFSFDFLSDFDRKNPLGIIELFKNFRSPEFSDIKLIIKGVNGNHVPTHRKMLQSKLSEIGHSAYFEGFWDSELIDTYAKNSLAYVSLHRSEGLGLPLLDSICNDVPTLATGFGGNLDFMGDFVDSLISFSRISTHEFPNSFYSNFESSWAEPDMDDAVDKLRFALNNPKNFLDRQKLYSSKTKKIHSNNFVVKDLLRKLN
jgi:hypothetical protein